MQAANLAAEDAIPDHLSGLWWVVHTRSRNEKVLAQDLHRMDIFNYLPLRPKVTRSKRTGRQSSSTVPVFTGYLFLNATEDQRHRALTTNRVANMLFVPSQEQLVLQLRHVHQVIGAGAAFEQVDEIQKGQWVRVITGPLEGIEGRVVQRLGRTRLAVSVDILGQSVLTEVNATWLEAAETPSLADSRFA